MTDTTINQDLQDLINDPGLSPKTTQDILGCKPTKFWELIKTGELESYRVGKARRAPHPFRGEHELGM